MTYTVGDTMTEETSTESAKSIDAIILEEEQKFFLKFDKVKSESNDAIQYIDSDGIDIQLIKCHSSALRFNDILAREKHIYNRMKAKYERMYAEMIDVAKQNPLMYRTANEIDGYIIRDARIARAKSILQNQQEMVEYLQSVLDLLKSKRFDLKTIADIRKVENGR